MGKKFYRLMIEFWWHVEHLYLPWLSLIGYRQRKSWEHKYVAKFNENIYGGKL